MQHPQSEKRHLCLDPTRAREPAKAGRGQHPVTGDQDGNRIGPASLADGLCRDAKFRGQIPIGPGFSIGNGAKREVECLLKIRPARGEWKGEAGQVPREIGGQFPGRPLHQIRLGRGILVPPLQRRDGPVPLGQGQATHGAIHASDHSAGSSLSCVRNSKSEASWRSCSCVAGSPAVRFTIRPRLTAGRA